MEPLLLDCVLVKRDEAIARNDHDEKNLEWRGEE
jgi:hypothetical protein